MFFQAVGLLIIAAGVAMAVIRKNPESAAAEALKGVKVEGPAWLILVCVGVFVVLVPNIPYFNSAAIPSTPSTLPPAELEEELEQVDDVDVLGPATIGDDVFLSLDGEELNADQYYEMLDQLWADCWDGDNTACDDLYLVSPPSANGPFWEPGDVDGDGDEIPPDWEDVGNYCADRSDVPLFGACAETLDG